MRTLFVAMIAVLLSGCAVDPKFKENFANGLNYRAQYQAQNNQMTQQYLQNNQVKSTDFQCVNDCQAAGYQRALCLSKCSY